MNLSEHTLFINSVSEPLEWEAIWVALVAAWNGDTADYNAECSECWQYMGTTYESGKWVHTFRHRCHPRTGRREYWKVEASPAFQRRHQRTENRPLRPYERAIPRFDPAHCSGAFDGVSVLTDAEGGL